MTLDLLTLGEAFEDLVFLDLPRLPNPGEEIRTSRFVRTVGGGAIITAVAAARLGLSCETWSAVGDQGVRRLRTEGVTVRNLRARNEDPAISAALSTASNRTFVTYDGVNDQLEGRLIARAAGIRARHAHFALGPRRCGAWIPVLRQLKLNGIGTSWDFGWNERLLDDPEFPLLLTSVDLLFLNEQEAVLYARRRRLPAALAHWRRSGTSVVIKLGPEGSRWVSPTRDLYEPPYPVRAVDTTGAGDAFNGGFLTARLRGLAPSTSLRLANRVGALSTRRAGGLDGLPKQADMPAALMRPPASPRRGSS